MSEATIQCADCGAQFIVTGGEATFLREKFGKDFAMPKRCRSCRQAKKERNKAK